MVTWILEKNVFSEKCFDEMVSHFKANDIPYHVVSIIPFIHEIDGKVPVIDGPVVCYGSIGIQKLAMKQNWKPAVFTNENFNSSSYKSLDDLFLNNDAVIMKMTEVEQYLKTFDGDVFFIKPDSDNKEFAGTVMEKSEFSKWYENMIDIGYLENNDFDVVISSPKKLGVEWRCIVVNGEVSTSSIYRQYQMVKPERNMNDDVVSLIKKAHDIFHPADVYVVDVAQVETYDGYELKIIEYNTFNSAGFYDCDVVKIIDDVNTFIES